MNLEKFIVHCEQSGSGIRRIPGTKEILMAKIGLAGFIHETNTFSNTPTPLENFLNQSGFYPELLRGEQILQLGEQKINIAASGFIAAANAFDLTVCPLVWCGTEP